MQKGTGVGRRLQGLGVLRRVSVLLRAILPESGEPGVEVGEEVVNTDGGGGVEVGGASAGRLQGWCRGVGRLKKIHAEGRDTT